MKIKLSAFITAALFALTFTSAQAQVTRDIVEPNIMTSPKPAAETKVPALDGLKPATPQSDIMVQPSEPSKAAAPAEPNKATPTPPTSAAVAPAKPAPETAVSDIDKLTRAIGSLKTSIEDVQRGQIDMTAKLGLMDKRIEAIEQGKTVPVSVIPPKADEKAAAVDQPKTEPEPTVAAAPKPVPDRFAGYTPSEMLSVKAMPQGMVLE